MNKTIYMLWASTEAHRYNIGPLRLADELQRLNAIENHYQQGVRTYTAKLSKKDLDHKITEAIRNLYFSR